MIFRIWLAVCLVVGLVACGSASDAPPGDRQVKTPKEADIPFERVGSGLNSNQTQSRYDQLKDVTLLTFSDQQSFNTFWISLGTGQSPEPEAPQIDFSTKMVLVVLCPFYSSGGFDIQVDEVFSSSEGYFVSATLTMPGQGCMVTAAVNQPFDIIEIDLTYEPISLLLTELTEDCL